MSFVRFIATLSAVSGLLLFAPTLSEAQNSSTSSRNSAANTSQQQTSKRGGGAVGTMNFEMKYDENLGQFFYVDPMGLEVLQNPFAPEVPIDAATYRLDVNDLISISVTGPLSIQFRAVPVNIQGDLNLPNLGIISVTGLTLNEAESRIREVVSENFKNVTVAVSLDKPRPLNVHITGDIPYPGKTIMPYGARLDVPIFNSLFPSVIDVQLTPNNMRYSNEAFENNQYLTNNQILMDPSWSFRDIKIQHKDGTTTTADLIDYFIGGNLDANPLMREGDVIHLAKQKEGNPRISISGAVNSAIQLEYRPDDTLGRLLRIAGGFTAQSDRQKIQIIRHTASGFETVEVNNNGDTALAMVLQPNDRVIVPYRHEPLQSHAVSVFGHATNPGIYPIMEGSTTVEDVLQLAGGLREDALYRAAYLIRSKQSVLDTETPQISVDELRRTSDQYQQNMNWFDQQMRNNSRKIFINLKDASQTRSIRLFDGDSLFIPINENTVFMHGQVNQPGYLPFQSGKSALDFIQDAGGFALAADQKRVFVLKAGSHAWFDHTMTTVEPGDQIYVDRIPVESVESRRNHEIQKKNLLNSRLSILLSAASTTILILNYIKNN